MRGFFFRFTHADGHVVEITCANEDEASARAEAEGKMEAFAGEGVVDRVVLADGSETIRPAACEVLDPSEYPNAPLGGQVRVIRPDGTVTLY
ncbi:MAG: hypothetical protein QOC92_2302 [Acidimicrobiaceae bacterium]